jgi:hypothetical protein
MLEMPLYKKGLLRKTVSIRTAEFCNKKRRCRSHVTVHSALSKHRVKIRKSQGAFTTSGP